MLSQLLSAYQSGNKDYLLLTLILMVLSLPIILVSLALHEAAHAFTAYRLGDRTARNLGRLTLNPAKHLDPLGAICMFLFGFGWAKPVPINPRYFKNPKWGMAISAIAGPACNLILSFLGMLGFQTVRRVVLIRYGVHLTGFGFWAPNPDWPTALLVMIILLDFFFLFSSYNAALAVFNLLPIPPFDGSRLAFVFLPDRWYWGIMKYERIIMIVILVGLATDLLVLPFSYISDMITGLFYHLTFFIGG